MDQDPKLKTIPDGLDLDTDLGQVELIADKIATANKDIALEVAAMMIEIHKKTAETLVRTNNNLKSWLIIQIIVSISTFLVLAMIGIAIFKFGIVIHNS